MSRRTKEERQLIADQIKKYASDLTPTAIAIEIGIDQVTVVSMAEEFSIELPHHKKKISFEENYKKHIDDMLKYSQDYTKNTYARNFGVSVSTIQRICNKYKYLTGNKIKFKQNKNKPKKSAVEIKENITVDNSMLFVPWVSSIDESNRNAMRIF